MKVGGDAKVCGVGAQVGDPGLRGLFHHVAELPGQRDFAFARCAERLDVERDAADRRIRETVSDADLRFTFSAFVAGRAGRLKAAEQNFHRACVRPPKGC